jgi:anti-sigma-K factor RskA
MRLAPLAALVQPDEPPPDVWEQIEARITPYRPDVPRVPWTSWLWKTWAIVATLATAAIAAFALLPALHMFGSAPVHLMGLMVPAATIREPAFIADVDRSGQLRVQAFRGALGGASATPPAGRVLQLWGLLPGVTDPIDLGLMPKEPGVVTISQSVLQPVPDMLVEISMEPEGGSTIGRPSGQIFFVGRLVGVTEPN